MADAPRPLTRAQLAAFIRDHQALRTMERMSQVSLVETPADMADVSAAISSINAAIAVINAALVSVNALVAALTEVVDDNLDLASTVDSRVNEAQALAVRMDDALLAPPAREPIEADNLLPPPVPLTAGALVAALGNALSANPTGTVGPTATNGTLNTYIRSDGAPAINLTATYPWTGVHNWSVRQQVFGTSTANIALVAGLADTGVSIHGVEQIRAHRVAAEPFIALLRVNTSYAAPSALVSGNSAGTIAWGGYDGSTIQPASAQVFLDVTETWSGVARGGNLRFQTTTTGATTRTDRLILGANATGGFALVPGGTAAQPGLAGTGDSNTGWTWQGSDVLSASTNATERLRFASTGDWGLAGANFGTAGQVITSNGSGSAPTWQNVSTFVGFSNTSIPAGNTVANTAAETAFTSSYTVAANSLRAGSVIRVKLFGTYSTDALVAPTLQGKMKIGGTTRLDTGALTAVLGATNRGWTAEGSIVVHSIGASGVADAQGTAQFATAATAALSVHMPNTATFTLDTTATQAITVTVQWGAADVDNTITLRQMIVEISNP
jgi:hypothetical protein